LHDLSGGRFILGLGAGASAARELGFPLGKLKRLRGFTRALRRLFREGACEFDGRPKELNPPRAVPVYIAAMGPKTIEFAGAEGDGVILQVGANRKTLTWAMNLLRTGAEKAGRDVSEIDVVVSAQCAVDQDRKAAIRKVRHLIGIYFYLAPHILKIAGLPGERTPVNTSVYPDLTHALDLDEAARATEFISDEVVESLGLIGSPDEWVDRLLMMEEVGVNHVQLRGPESFSLPAGEIAFCRDEVIPRLLKAQGGTR
jgi:5,10-methylenetetrahydromethanopterin reductase